MQWMPATSLQAVVNKFPLQTGKPLTVDCPGNAAYSGKASASAKYSGCMLLGHTPAGLLLSHSLPSIAQVQIGQLHCSAQTVTYLGGALAPAPLGTRKKFAGVCHFLVNFCEYICQCQS